MISLNGQRIENSKKNNSKSFVNIHHKILEAISLRGGWRHVVMEEMRKQCQLYIQLPQRIGL